MPERLFQGRFDLRNSQLTFVDACDVTPAGFTALPLPHRLPVASPEPTPPEIYHFTGRFIREASQEIAIASPEIAAYHLMNHVYTPFTAFDQEEMWVLLLNTKNYVTHEALVYRGTVNSAIVRVAEIFKPAVRVNATTLVVSHNHPSGDPTPSPEDIQVTRSIVEAGKLLGIEVLDHILIGNNVWVSLKERGLSGFE